MQTYLVNYLPGSTSVLLGYNEKRRLDIDTEIGKTIAPKQPNVVFRVAPDTENSDATNLQQLQRLYKVTIGKGADVRIGNGCIEIRRPVIPKPRTCALKEACADWQKKLQRVEQVQFEQELKMHEVAHDAMITEATLPEGLDEADYMLG